MALEREECFIREAESTLLGLSLQLEKKTPIGSFSTAVYDTAWLARILTKDSQPKWLFPQSFQYLLDTQHESGGWPRAGSETNDILNTMAAIIAIKDHEMRPDITCNPPVTDLPKRLDNATKHLEEILVQWDISTTTQVGFEILIPSMLETLGEAGIRLSFPSQQTLMSLHRQKMSSVQLSVLYTKHKTTLLHSLEAFVGKVNFDRVAHHLDKHGSIMASPAATAAYLMHCTAWDTAAERYLRHVVAHGSGKGAGGVPSAFPTSIFETSWIASVLMKTALAPLLLKQESTQIIHKYLDHQLSSFQGVVGWDSGVLADADDTVKTILALNLMGASANPAAMVEKFQVKGHFQTYQDERNPSLSANCNVLDALLHTSHIEEYSSQIQEVASFICETYLSGIFRDKWNTSEYYSSMLISQVLVKLLQVWDAGALHNLPEDLTCHQMPIILFQIAIRSIQAHRPDGSWGLEGPENIFPSPQITAYAVLALKSLESLPWLGMFQDKIREAIETGTVYILGHINASLDHETIWVEKVTYALPPVSRAYCVAALCPATSYCWKDKVLGVASTNSLKVKSLAKFFFQLQMFSEDKMWDLEADVALGYLYQPMLRRASSQVFPQRHDVTYYKYLEYIPFTWIATNRRNNYPLSNNQLWETMMIAVLDYQLDEFMETAFDGKESADNVDAVKALVKDLCGLALDEPICTSDASSSVTSTKRQNIDEGVCADVHSIDSNGFTCTIPKSDYNGITGSSILEDITPVLSHFTSYIFQHQAVAKAPAHIRKNVQAELGRCILAHIDHVEDNFHFTAQSPRRLSGSSPLGTNIPKLQPSRQTYYSWIRTTGADDTHAPFTFQFFACVAACAPGEAFFQGVRQHYLSSAASRHLANLCRQYNDYGSVARDQAEENLNSLNFPEFHEAAPDNQERNEASMKKDLYFIAQYERACLNHTMEALGTELSSSPRGTWKLQALKVFVDTVDLYGQLYVARDVTPRVK